MEEKNLEQLAKECKGKEQRFLIKGHPYCMLKLKHPEIKCKYLGKSYEMDLPFVSGEIKRCGYEKKTK